MITLKCFEIKEKDKHSGTNANGFINKRGINTQQIIWCGIPH